MELSVLEIKKHSINIHFILYKFVLWICDNNSYYYYYFSDFYLTLCAFKSVVLPCYWYNFKSTHKEKSKSKENFCLYYVLVNDNHGIFLSVYFFHIHYHCHCIILLFMSKIYIHLFVKEKLGITFCYMQNQCITERYLFKFLRQISSRNINIGK